MDSFDNLSASEKAEATELQRMIAIEQQKAQFQAQVCVYANHANRKGIICQKISLSSICLSCVERFIDTTLTITNRFTQMVQKGAH
uniref:Uncharacterized protein n=1 Tax=Acanthochromis polyacanthus TaxID=80966 RepID=A0A3Q1EZ47_9TELE